MRDDRSNNICKSFNVFQVREWWGDTIKMHTKWGGGGELDTSCSRCGPMAGGLLVVSQQET
jgi:hypothetical protein